VINYQGTNSWVPSSEKVICPKCQSTNLRDVGECAEGCCDKYECSDCEYKFWIEWPD